MAYNLIIELGASASWNEVHAALTPLLGAVEAFPIPAEDSAAMAVGISVPRKSVVPEEWESLLGVIQLARSRWSGRVFDLYSGEEVAPGAEAALHHRLFGGSAGA